MNFALQYCNSTIANFNWEVSENFKYSAKEKFGCFDISNCVTDKVSKFHK